ncbi:MAG: zf-HC2 domain-containing protein [Oscillospiraceae bacterium]|nr:zf-HC2 domain-containing protein [Oscillospiraceae bacterium]
MINCGIAQDLMPLYADSVCTQESRTALEEHIQNCTDCRKKLELMTAELENITPPKEEIKHADVFKRLHKNHLRLAAAALVICLILLVPTVTCGILYVNEKTNLGISFSTLSADRAVKHIGSLLKKSSYSEALDSFVMHEESKWENDELEEMKDILAQDMSAYFAAHPIKKVRAFSKQTQTGSVEARLLLELEKPEGCAEVPAFFIEFRCYGDELRYERSGVEFGSQYNRRTGFYESEDTELTSKQIYRSYYADMPELKLVHPDFSEEYFRKMRYPDEIPQAWFISLEKYDSLMETGGADWYKAYEELYDKTVELSWKYQFFQCKTGKTEYITDDPDGRYYLQHAEVVFYNHDGKFFWVQMHIPYNLSCYPLMFSHAENITFSDNAPDEFRVMFTEIFGK